MKNVLIFGSTGTIGNACVKLFQSRGIDTTSAPRDIDSEFLRGAHFDSVVWAQGKNLTASVEETSAAQELEIFSANYFYVTKTLKLLLDESAIGAGSKLVVISSVWEKSSRSNKSAYIASKAALGGLVRALAVELGSKGISINAVLPGVIDSEMTRSNLTSTQIEEVESKTPGGNLVSLTNVANAVHFFSSSMSNGINGQSILIDQGWSISHEI